MWEEAGDAPKKGCFCRGAAGKAATAVCVAAGPGIAKGDACLGLLDARVPAEDNMLVACLRCGALPAPLQ